MNGSNNSLKHNILIPTISPDAKANNKTNTNLETAIETIKCEAIPMCNECLFEIKDGNYICLFCKLNLCESHLKNHNEKYNKNNKSNISEFHKIYRLEL